MKKHRQHEDIGIGTMCRKCNIPTVIRKRTKVPIHQNFYYTQWEYCKKCNAVYFEEKYKSNDWKELEHNENMFKNSLFED